MHFLAPALAVLTALSQMTSALATPVNVADLTNFFTTSQSITFSAAQTYAADFVAVMPDLTAAIANEGSIAGMAADAESYVVHYVGEVNSDFTAFLAFAGLLDRTAQSLAA